MIKSELERLSILDDVSFDGMYTETSKAVPNLRIRALVNYCKEKAIATSELTEEEISRFRHNSIKE